MDNYKKWTAILLLIAFCLSKRAIGQDMPYYMGGFKAFHTALYSASAEGQDFYDKNSSDLFLTRFTVKENEDTVSDVYFLTPVPEEMKKVIFFMLRHTNKHWTSEHKQLTFVLPLQYYQNNDPLNSKIQGKFLLNFDQSLWSNLQECILIKPIQILVTKVY